MAKIHDLKKENISLIRSCFYEGGIWTKNTLSEKTGLSLAGTTNVLQYLMNENEIIQTGKAASTGGRKSKQYVLNPDQAQIGTLILKLTDKGCQFQTFLQDMGAEEVYENTLFSADGSIHDFDKAVNNLLSNSQNMKVLCVSVPGVCADGVIGICDFRSFVNFPIGKHIDETWHLNWIVENDANSACIGLAHEYPDIRNMAVIYQPVKDGFGCGIVIDGKLYNGYSHAAGELGNLPFARQEDDALKQLETAIETIVCVLNPEMIGYASDCLENEPTDLIHCDNLEKLVEIHDFTGLVQYGLNAMGRNLLLKMHQ